MADTHAINFDGFAPKQNKFGSQNEEHCFETFIIDSANSEDQLTDNLKHIMYICNRKPVDTRMYIIIITIDIYISQETLKSLLLVILPALKQ